METVSAESSSLASREDTLTAEGKEFEPTNFFALIKS
jgi:hypothetical protein